MRNNPGRFSVRLLLLASVAGCQILMISAMAAAAERPDGSDKEPTPKLLNFQAPVAVIDLREVHNEQRAASMNQAGPRKGDLFRGLSEAGVEVPASTWPDPGLFLELRVSETGTAPTGTGTADGPAPNGKQGPAREKPSTVASTAPMTAGEKFELFAIKSFKPPAPYALSIVSGVWTEATDSKHKKPHRSAGDFAADSLTHAARSYAFRVTSNFFEKFAYASLFKQDPRYHR